MYQNSVPMFNPFAQNVAIIKNYFKKPIVLITAILTAVAILVSIIASVVSVPLYVELSEMLQEIPELEDIEISISSNISIPVFAVLTAVAFFLIYFKSKNDDPFSNPVNGVTILSVLALIEVIGVCLALAIFLLVIAAACALPSLVEDASEFDIQMLSIFLIVFCVVFLIILGVSLVYAISQRKFYKSIKDGLTSPTLSAKGAGVFGTMSIIFGAFSALSAISSLFSVPSFEAGLELFGINPDLIDLSVLAPIFYFSAFTSVLCAAQQLLIGFIARGYKNYINEIACSYNNNPNAYGQPQYYQQAAPVAQAYPTPAAPQQNPFEINENTTPMENTAADSDTIVCPCCKKRLPKEVLFCDSCGNKIQ